MPFFGFPKVKWLHLTGEMDKSVRFSCEIFSGFNTPKIIKISEFLTELFKNKKVYVFWDTGYCGKYIVASFHGWQRSQKHLREEWNSKFFSFNKTFTSHIKLLFTVKRTQKDSSEASK